MKSPGIYFLLKILVFVLINLSCFSYKEAFCKVWEDSDWIVSVWECRAENISKGEAIQRALDEARTIAIAYVVGIKVTDDVMINQNEQRVLYERFTNINTSGHIVAEEYKVSEMDDFGTDKHGISIKKYSVTLRCKVEKEYGIPDPTFDVSFEMNKIIYKSKDTIELEITAKKDCYITILNLHELENKVYIIFPNEYDNDNFFKANTKRIIPSPNRGIVLRAIIPEGKNESRERIKVIATKKKIDFSLGLPKESIYNYYPTPVAAGSKIGKILVNMPRNEWTQETQTIWIKNRD